MYVEGDLFDIGSRVKDIDPLLSLSLNRDEGRYEIHRQDRMVMAVKPGCLNAGVLVQLRKNDLTRRRLEDYILELERAEDEYERKRAKGLRNKMESMALDNFDKIVGIPHFACGHWGGDNSAG